MGLQAIAEIRGKTNVVQPVVSVARVNTVPTANKLADRVLKILNPDLKGRDIREAFKRGNYQFLSSRTNSRPASTNHSSVACMSTCG